MQGFAQTYGGLQAIGAETQRQQANALANKAAEEGMAAKKDLRNIYKQGGDVAQNLLAGGFGEEAQKYKSQEMSQQLTALQQNKEEIENALQMYGAIGQIAGTVQDQQSYDMAREQIAQINPDAAANMPDMYDPAMIEQNKMKALSVQEQLFNSYKEADYEIRQRELELRESGQGASTGTPYFTPVQTAQGVMSFDARTGRIAPVDVGGAPVVGATADPLLQEKLAKAKKVGAVTGEITTEASFDLPRVIGEGENTIKLVDELLTHPGFKQAVGKSRLMGMQKVPGTEAYGFQTRLDQIKGKQFLQAFQSLKGGGQITEAEGNKATQAVARMDASQNEKEFIKAANEFKSVIKKGIERAKKKTGVDSVQQQPQQVSPQESPPGAAFSGINPETNQMEYFDAQGNRL
ncbi:hypothetical protein [Sulfurovum sp.]|uniref:hypothetical protein n=1 Tax=Sulfurovum sp. TaxID=1969726 RepID=UPI0035679945